MPRSRRATRAQKRARIDLINNYRAQLRDVSDDDLIGILMRQEQLSHRQARRYLHEADCELERLGRGLSPKTLGLLKKQAEYLSSQTLLAVMQEKTPERIKMSLAAHRNEVQTERTLRTLQRGLTNDPTASTGPVQTDPLADILRLFREEGSSESPGSV